MFFCFFFQAEDGIRDGRVTGVQTCALPICKQRGAAADHHLAAAGVSYHQLPPGVGIQADLLPVGAEPPWLGVVYRRSPHRGCYHVTRNLLVGERPRPSQPLNGERENIHGSSQTAACRKCLCHQPTSPRGHSADAEVRIQGDLRPRSVTSGDAWPGHTQPRLGYLSSSQVSVDAGTLSPTSPTIARVRAYAQSRLLTSMSRCPPVSHRGYL